MSTEIDFEEEKESKRLTPAQWAEIQALWEGGTVTLKELSERFDVSEPSLSRGLKKRGAVKGSRAGEIGRAAAKAATAAATAEAESFAARRRRRIEETKESHYKWAETIGKLMMAELAKAQAAGVAFGTTLKSMQALRLAAAGLKDVREERYALLDVDSEVDQTSLPELTIRELSQAEIDTLRDTEEDDLMPKEPVEPVPDEIVVEDES